MKRYLICICLVALVTGCAPYAATNSVQTISGHTDAIAASVMAMSETAGQIVETTKETDTKVRATEIQTRGEEALKDTAAIEPALTALQKKNTETEAALAAYKTGAQKLASLVYMGLVAAGALAIALGGYMAFTGATKMGFGAACGGVLLIGAVEVLQRFDNWLDKYFGYIMWSLLGIVVIGIVVGAYYLWTHKKALKEVVDMVDGAIKPVLLSVGSAAPLVAAAKSMFVDGGIADQTQSPTTKAIIADIRGK